jgi:type IV secretory pathway TrbD component
MFLVRRGRFLLALIILTWVILCFNIMMWGATLSALKRAKKNRPNVSQVEVTEIKREVVVE